MVPSAAVRFPFPPIPPVATALTIAVPPIDDALATAVALPPSPAFDPEKFDVALPPAAPVAAANDWAFPWPPDAAALLVLAEPPVPPPIGATEEPERGAAHAACRGCGR